MSGEDHSAVDWKVLLGIVVGLAVGVGLVAAAASYTPVSGEQALSANTNATIIVDGASEINLSQPFINDSAVRVETASGNLTMVGTGDAVATVAASDIVGPTTALTGINASAAALTINPDDKPAFTVGGGIETVAVRDSFSIDDGVVDFSYSGPDGTESRITVQGLSSDATVGAVDANSGALLDVATVSADGSLTFDQLDNSAHDVLLQTGNTGTLTNGSPDATTVYTTGPELSVNLSDPDFPGDDVTLEWSVDGTVIATTTAASNGTYSITATGLAEGSHDWSVTATDAYGKSYSSATYTFTVDHYDPKLSDPQPDSDLTYLPSELSVNLSDADFVGDGDSIDVQFSLNGDPVETVTATSNGTVAVSIPDRGLIGGQHSWSVEATDSYGGTDAASATYSIPSNLTIYNESNPSEVLDNTSIEATFYYENGTQSESVTRSTSTGVINLTGLPANQPLIVNAEADGFRDRRIFIRNIVNQQEVYLLPENIDFTQTTFDLRDYTGSFPQDTTVLYVSRSLNGSYKAVLGDYFGANGQFPAELAYNERHRLTLLNTKTGETRDLGTYTPLASGDQTLSVSVSGQVDVVGREASVDVDPAAQRLPARNVSMAFHLDDGGSDIDSYELTVTHINATGNETLYQTTTDGGTLMHEVNLTNASGTVLIETTLVKDGEAVAKRSKSYRIISHDSDSATILGSLETLLGQVPASNEDAFTTTLAIIVTVISTIAVATRRGVSSEIAGVVGVGWLATFGIIGWVGYDLLFVGIAGWVSLAALRRVV